MAIELLFYYHEVHQHGAISTCNINMAIFYRGAGPGTHWDKLDAQRQGFQAQAPFATPSPDRLRSHIAQNTQSTPYISLTRSYGVALHYACFSGNQLIATQSSPGVVYELEFNDPLPPGLILIDPIQEIASSLGNPLSLNSYHHDGSPEFLLGVVDPIKHKKELQSHCPTLPGAIPHPPNLSIELAALVRSLRDAEILATGNIPNACVKNRWNVWL